MVSSSPYKFLRPEQKFAGLPELTKQIQADCVAAQDFYREGNHQID
jgi:FAD synthase